MANERPLILGNVINVIDVADGKRVTLKIRAPTLLGQSTDLRDRIMDGRARGRALIGAGVMEEGFVRDMNIDLEKPTLERKTEIADKTQIDDDIWRYIIKVKSGVILE